MDRLRFFEELKRRHVYKVAAVYAVVAWVVIQIAATALPYLLDRPDPVIKVIIILSLVGFPVALALGWIFDVTPQGLQRTEAQPQTTLAARASAAPNRARIVAAGSLLVAAVAVGFALWYVRENTAPPAPQPSMGEFGAEFQRQVQEQLKGLGDGTSPTKLGDGTSPAKTDAEAPGVHAVPNMDSLLNVAGAAMASLGGGLLRAQGPMPASMKRVAVFPFRVPAGLDADAGWGQRAADSLSTALANAGFGTVDGAAARKAVDAARPDPDDRAAYAAVARRLGADAFITGYLVPQASSVVLDVALSGTDAPRSVRSARGFVPADGFGTGLERLVSRLTTASDSAGAP